jgi:hypothetical protein
MEYNVEIAESSHYQYQWSAKKPKVKNVRKVSQTTTPEHQQIRLNTNGTAIPS